MASIKFYLDTRAKRKDGKFQLKLGVTRGQDYALVSLNVLLSLEQWDRTSKKVVKHPNRLFLNSYINRKLLDAESVLLDLQMSGVLKSLNIYDIKKTIEKRLEGEKEEKSCKLLFADHYQKFAASRNKERTKQIYQSTFNRIKGFADISTLTFDEMNRTWLKAFENYLTEATPSINARAIHLRNIRAVFNDALDDELISCYPFRKFKIKGEATIKRSLSLQDLIILRDYPCEEHQKQYRDVFMLIFYLRGINIVDLCGLTEIVNERVEYRRAKTSKLYSIKVEPEAAEIIERYQGKRFLLDIRDRYSNYKDYAQRLNKNLREIGNVTIAGRGGKKHRAPLFPQITTYWARHTWATLAASLDIPKETIAAGLGHGRNSVTDVYIDFDMKKVDEANRKILDALKA